MDQSAKKEFVYFLLRRWRALVSCAAIERVYEASVTFTVEYDEPEPATVFMSIPYPCRQIEIIKQHIISVLPEAKFINYSYYSEAPLNPGDFVELFTSDHLLCMQKVKKVLLRGASQDGIKDS
jgi:hypothetical protein